MTFQMLSNDFLAPPKVLERRALGLRIILCHLQFRQLYEVSIYVARHFWKRASNVATKIVKRNNLVSALMILKTHVTEAVLYALTGVHRKTFQKWM